MTEVVRTGAVARVEGIVHSIADRPGRWAALIGAVGTGKTWAVGKSLENLSGAQFKVIRIDCLQTETLSMSAIQDVMIQDLGEKPLRFGPAKAVQLRRLLGAATKGRKVLLVIDEAHALPLSVFRGLKRLRDMTFAAREGILSILLVAQPELEDRVRSKEANERILKYRMPGIKKHDGEMIARALAEDEDKVKFSDEAIRELALMSVTPLNLYNWVTLMGVWCEERGVKRIEGGMVAEILKRTKQALMNHYHISNVDVARRAELSTATVSGVLGGKYLGRRETVEEVDQALDALIAEKKAAGAQEPEAELVEVRR